MGRRCRPRAAILGSRQQMCLNPGVKRLPGGAMNQACRAHVGARTCSWCAPTANPVAFAFSVAFLLALQEGSL